MKHEFDHNDADADAEWFYKAMRESVTHATLLVAVMAAMAIILNYLE